MVTRAGRRRIPTLPLECWELIVTHLSAHGREPVRALSRVTSEHIPSISVPDGIYAYMICHGRVFVRVQCTAGAWIITCIDSADGKMHTSNEIHNLSRRLWNASSRYESYRCGPIVVKLTRSGSQLTWKLRRGSFSYQWPMDRKMNNVLRTHYLTPSELGTA
jgi:hypothetical protein